MSIGVVGVNHLCPIHIREKVCFTHSKKIQALDDLKERGIQEIVILATCNRTEIYIWDQDLASKIQIVKAFFLDFLDEEELEDYMLCKSGKKAIKHLCYVASGLDSIVIGEDQVLGQVKEAWELASKQKTCGKMLNKLFREAITTAKSIKNNLKISEHPLSISYVAVKFLKEKMQSLTQKNILVIGIGKMSQLVIKYLQDEQIGTIYVSNRSHNKAQQVESLYENVVAVSYQDRYLLLNKVDAVICATASPHVILQKQAMPKLTDKLYMMDIALPRDIDPKLNEIELIELYDIDDLKMICKKNNETRKELSYQAKEMIRYKINELEEWIQFIEVENVLARLNDKKEEILQCTLEVIDKKTKVSEEDKKVIDKMLSAALKNLLISPTANLKKIKDKEQREKYIQVIEDLFEL